MRAKLLIGIAAVTLLVSSARTRVDKRETVSAAPAVQASGTEYRNRSGHFALRYPPDWSQKATKEYTLLLERDLTGDAVRVTVDVPYIPPHLPGMVTMGRVVKGYLDDLRNRLNDSNVVERGEDRLGGNAAQWLVVTGRERAGGHRGEQRTIVALIAIRSERVYILQADATPELVGAACDAMTNVEASWEWIR